MSVLSSLSQELTLSNSALTALVFSHKWVRMKLNMNERHVRREELPLLKSKCHCSTTPSGKDWVEPPRKVEKWSPTSSSRAQLLSAVTPRREPFFLQVKHPVSTNKDSVFFFFFFYSSGFVLVWNSINTDCPSVSPVDTSVSYTS